MANNVNIFDKDGIKEVANVYFEALDDDLKTGVYQGDIVLFLGLKEWNLSILQGWMVSGQQFSLMGLGIFPILGQPAVCEKGFSIGFHDFQQCSTQGIGRLPV